MFSKKSRICVQIRDFLFQPTPPEKIQSFLKNFKIMKIFKTVLPFVLITLFAFSCEKDECCEFPTEEVRLVWTGDYALDGCGYIFTFKNGTERKVTNEETIPERFKSETGILVTIEFDGFNTDKIRPCFTPTEYETFELKSIN